MGANLSRRELLRLLGVSAASAGAITLEGTVRADMAMQKGAKRGTLSDGSGVSPCQFDQGRVIRPSLEIPTIENTDVLVVGAGPAGATAAIAAARAGVKVTLVERYNHFGGLATGGLVLIILGQWTKGNVQVLQGIGEEMMQRLEKMPYGICNRRPGVNPTIDAEAYKYLLVEMIMEEKINVFLHSWAIDAITEGDVVKGAVIQTKLGPKAILAKQVIDTTGDGDIFAFAGVPHDRREYHIGLPHRLGDMATLNKGEPRPRNYGDVTPIEGVRWVNMQGPTVDGLEVETLTKLELQHRRKIWADYLKLRETHGFEQVKMLETAPQMGVRITRVIEGTKELTVKGVLDNQVFDDCVGIGGAWNGDHQGWQLPYGALLPVRGENILTAGRSISAEPLMSDLIRVIPNCWVSGHAAGCAAAVAVLEETTARKVDLRKVRELLIKQDAFLG